MVPQFGVPQNQLESKLHRFLRPPPQTYWNWIFKEWDMGSFIFYFFKDFIYSFLEREEGKEKERETSLGGNSISCAPYWGPGRQPRHVPQLGIKPVTLWFAGWHSIHWATPAGRAGGIVLFLNIPYVILVLITDHQSTDRDSGAPTLNNHTGVTSRMSRAPNLW